jgi:hypothetical protein
MNGNATGSARLSLDAFDAVFGSGAAPRTTAAVRSACGTTSIRGEVPPVGRRGDRAHEPLLVQTTMPAPRSRRLRHSHPDDPAQDGWVSPWLHSPPTLRRAHIFGTCLSAGIDATGASSGEFAKLPVGPVDA